MNKMRPNAWVELNIVIRNAEVESENTTLCVKGAEWDKVVEALQFHLPVILDVLREEMDPVLFNQLFYTNNGTH